MKTTENLRSVEVLVISDVHLGTYGSRAAELLGYLKSIRPQRVYLNGDIIDIWQFKKHYFPKEHLKVIKHIMNWVSEGIPVTYITGNHDEMLRRFAGFRMGSFSIENKELIELNGEKTWIFHGDVFDVTMQHSKWLAKLGAIGYDTLILINTFCNWFSEKILKRGRISLSKKIKNSVKGAVKFINDFEATAAEIAIANGYDYVICGHIHQPQKRMVIQSEGAVMYLNSGDWIENLTALEYNNKKWEIYSFESDSLPQSVKEKDLAEDLKLETDHLFASLLAEFNAVPTKQN
jgi:UDP-2,3-diacylglucosamine pyrophosphatase LpxH